MLKPLVTGVLLAVAAALVLTLGQGSDLEHAALLGAALGGVLGLVHPEQGVGRLAGAVLGFLVAWAGFALRAAVLPDTTAGRAVAAAAVLLICALVAGLSRNRLPLWSMLLGGAALVAAYEATYRNAPALFLTESPRAATTIGVAAAVGVLLTSLAHVVLPDRSRDAEAETGRTPNRALRDRLRRRDTEPTESMDDLLGDKA
ncbi:hypothetical protein B0O41_1779 [Propionibacteriaceae bacterium ES.041]|uniref:hypothetical protein n=1 Tax=Enemella evansiae TaxID=2016499 RepID=UPI000B964D47|nr:hypothetical protein [Enemella evansiae]OYO02268.1 hypothetical protein CGZ96_02680 [Enemella evansiae]PFG66974.1 hypothetical protein B0O41_1779 [Propionibacteriaceae bacterium ES.041]